jgi:hypothetical protein
LGILTQAMKKNPKSHELLNITGSLMSRRALRSFVGRLPKVRQIRTPTINMQCLDSAGDDVNSPVKADYLYSCAGELQSSCLATLCTCRICQGSSL